MGRIAIALLAVALLPACAGFFRVEERRDTTLHEISMTAAPGPVATTPRWPVSPDAPGDCVTTYPDDLPQRAYAFDGTVLSVQRGVYDQDAGATPITLQVAVNRSFKGDLGAAVDLHTWEFEPGEFDQDDPDVVGARALFATGETLDVMWCGFTRPYSEAEAEEWARVFAVTGD